MIAKHTLLRLFPSIIMASSLLATHTRAQGMYDALTKGKASVDIRLRYENVVQDNTFDDADAFTVRTRLAYQSGDFEGFSFKLEMEDNRIALGLGDYTVGPAGYNLGSYSVIADPEFTELDQGYIQYKKEAFTLKVGRQVITLDGHRYIGHVGWRQDRQTFDAVSAVYSPNDKFKTHYSYINQRNRIFGEFADVEAKDHLLNLSYMTNFGTLVGYAYLLEVDNASTNGLDTYGFSFRGNKKLNGMKLGYAFEYASQTTETVSIDYKTDYLFGEIGATLSGIMAKIGYEVLGSDDGQIGFATPLATLHKFNGWSDQFLATPAQGLKDTIFTLAGGLAGGKWLLVYHNFEAGEPSSDLDDLGSEVNLQYTTKISHHFTLGIKYADYSGESGRVDTTKTWLWLESTF